MSISYPGMWVNRKTILIVEDHEAQRLALQKALRRRGFHAEAAGDVATARTLAEKLGARLDVMVLDMRLEDPEEPAITGADLGIEVRSTRSKWPPEFLINSAYEEVDYYRLAFRLGAAAYLRKEEQVHHQLIRHIRALSLRRGLSMERPNAAEQIRKIAETSRNRSEAVARFCADALAPELGSCLGAPFVILLTDDTGTRCCAGDAGIPERPLVIYETVQALAQSRLGLMEPFVLDASKLKEPKDSLECDILNRLDGSAFLPLSIRPDIRLSIGIIRDNHDGNILTEDPVELAKVLAQYLRPAVLEQLLSILSQWAEVSAQRKAVLRATAQFCLYVGQEQESILSEMAASQEAQVIETSLQKLYSLAGDLRETGEILIPIGGDEDKSGRSATAEVSYGAVGLAEIVRLAAEDLAGQLPKDAISIHGDCTLRVVPDDLYVAASRLLQWFAHRAIETSLGTSPLIHVNCDDTGEELKVVFEDRSRRLSSRLRHQLFSPFTQAAPPPSTSGGPGLHIPLYLAKALVEVRNGGVLEDRSDEMEGDVGHRFVMRFPPTEARANRANV